MAICDVCFRQCKIEEGSTGFCGARTCRDGKVVAANYGRLTSIALDPIEKKPLKMFHPGSQILSLGSYGCNLRCPFCQNYSISWSQKAFEYKDKAEYYAPEEIVKIASDLRPRGNIGLAFTYNEPLIGYEFIRDTAKLSKESIGYGDAFMLIAIGTFCPITELLFLLLCGFLMAGIVSILLLVLKKRNKKEEIPLIPFLLGGYVLTLPFF